MVNHWERIERAKFLPFTLFWYITGYSSYYPFLNLIPTHVIPTVTLVLAIYFCKGLQPFASFSSFVLVDVPVVVKMIEEVVGKAVMATAVVSLAVVSSVVVSTAVSLGIKSIWDHCAAVSAISI